MDEHVHKEFLQLVQQMRSAQKEYFATRDKVVLGISKQLERQVDKFLDDANRPGLF